LKKHGIRYDERFRYASDYHFVFQCAKRFKLFNIDPVLVKYRIRNDGITGSRFLEQQKFAAQIRRGIVSHYFGRYMDVSERDLICAVLGREKKPETDISKTERALNRILEINHAEKLFPKDILYTLLCKAAADLIDHFGKSPVRQSLPPVHPEGKSS